MFGLVSEGQKTRESKRAREQEAVSQTDRAAWETAKRNKRSQRLFVVIRSQIFL